MTHSHPVAKKTTSCAWAWWALFHFLCLTSTADFLTVSAEAEDLSYMGSMDRFWRHHVETQTLEHKGVNYFPLIQSCLVERLSPEEWEAIPNVRSESRAVGRKVMMEEEDSSDDDHDTAVLVVVQKATTCTTCMVLHDLVGSCSRRNGVGLYGQIRRKQTESREAGCYPFAGVQGTQQGTTQRNAGGGGGTR